MIFDTGDELVEISDAVVQGLATKPDGSILFKMIGGPYHGMKLRVEAPFDRVVFKVRGETIVYRLRPPHNSKDKWVYGYDVLDEQPLSESEKGFDASVLNDRWAAAFKFLAREKEARIERAEEKLRLQRKQNGL